MGMKEKTGFIGFEVFFFFIIERRNLRERRENKCRGAYIEWLFFWCFQENAWAYLPNYPSTFYFLGKNRYSQTQMNYKTYKTQKGNLQLRIKLKYTT